MGDSLEAKYRALEDHHSESELGKTSEGDHLRGFGVAKFRKWMKTGDKKNEPKKLAKKAILSYIHDVRDPPNKEEVAHRHGRVAAMCFALLLVEDVLKAQTCWDESHIKILAAAVIHAPETQSASSLSLWEHICDVIYPPKQHQEETALCRCVAACTMGDERFMFQIVQPDNAVTQLGCFLKADVADSVTKWEKVHLTSGAGVSVLHPQRSAIGSMSNKRRRSNPGPEFCVCTPGVRVLSL